MSRWFPITILFATSLALVASQGPQAQGQAVPSQQVPDEVLVQFSRFTPNARRAAILAAESGREIRRFDSLDIHHVRLAAGRNIEQTLAALRRNPEVVAAQPNYRRSIVASAPPNDPLWLDGTLWGLQKIQAQPVWTGYTTGNGTVVIADIDTGINYNHPDLAANVWRNPGEIPGNGIDDDGDGYVDDVYGIDTANGDTDPLDDNGHGTHTAGTLAGVGNNGVGVTGVNWNAKVLSCKFLDANGNGSDSGAIACFNYVLALKQRGINIRVTSNSWGGARGNGPPAATLQNAIDALGAAGILNVFAAGNSGTNNDSTPFDPASMTSSSIVSVAASDQSDNRASFSNYGVTSVDLAAPGVSITSTYGNGYAALSGTSMATPHVAGAAALLSSMDPSLSVDALKFVLLNQVDRLPQWNGVVASGGRLNLLNAVTSIAPNSPPTVALTTPAPGATFVAPASIGLAATASDSDGTVASVAFYANSTLLGTDTTSPFSFNWLNVAAGTYTLTAIATDNRGATTTSSPVSVTVTPAVGRINVALAANGGTAVASSTFGTDYSYAPGGAINGDRRGQPWGYGAGWNDGTLNTWPDWLEVDFAGSQTISEVDVFSLQDDHFNPSDPTPSMTFALDGLTNFEVQYWTGSAWLDVPGGAIVNNNLVWRQVNFAPLTTAKIRIWITGALGGYSRIMEVEAYTSSGANSPPTVSLTAPSPGAAFTAPATINLAATASDSDGTVASVAFYANGLLVGTDSTSPFAFSWLNVAAGSFVLTAVATDDKGATTTSAPVTVTVNSPPTVALTSPANGATFAPPATINFAATAGDSDGTVAGVAFYANGALVGIDSTSPFSFSWLNVAAGSYVLTAIATDDKGATTTSAPVSVTVSVNSPPTVALTAPANGATFTAPASINLAATAGDSDGSVASVAFYANGSLVGTDTTSPFALTWSSVAAGMYTLTAIATDDKGAATTSAPVTITVNTVVVSGVNVALAANGGTAIASSTLGTDYSYAPGGAINGDRRGQPWGYGAGWNDGTLNTWPDWLEVDFAGSQTIAEVDVFSMQDDHYNPSDPTPSMTFTQNGLTNFEVQYWTGSAWLDVPGGAIVNNNLVWRQVTFAPLTTAKIRIWVTGSLGGYSRIMEVEAYTSSGGSNSPPTVALTAPAGGATFPAPATINLAATAGDSDGTVASVAFYANGSLVGTDTTSPFALTWPGVAAGTYTLTAVATDDKGATTTSAPVAITVTAATNTPPTVALTAPANGATFTAPASVNLAATAGDSDGSVASVAFYANGSLVGTDTTSPFALTWSSVAAGTYTLTAVATDDKGATTTSAPVTITVTTVVVSGVNVALAANGGSAIASSTLGSGYEYAAAGAINGDRRGQPWGYGAGWNDGTPDSWPDWLEVDFAGSQTIAEVDVFSMQDDHYNPSDPTPSMTFTQNGLTNFEVQYWTGSAWLPVPGGSITGKNLVWRKVTFAPLTTTRIRIWVTAALNSYSRIVEVEAYTSGTAPAQAPAIDPTAPPKSLAPRRFR